MSRRAVSAVAGRPPQTRLLSCAAAVVPASVAVAVAVCAPALRRFSSNHDASHHRQPTSRVAGGADYYALLEVHRHHLTEGDLKQAYYRLAKQYHPDRLVDLCEAERTVAEKKFALIGVAYAVLSDPVKRQQYDIFMDLSSIGDQDRMLHWVKINRPPDQIGYEGFTPAYEAGYDRKETPATSSASPAAAASTTPSPATAPAKPSKPKPALPVFRSS